MRRAAMASVVEDLKQLFDRQQLLLQRLADDNRQFFTRLVQLPTIEKQSIKVLARSNNQQPLESESRASNMENQLRSCLLKDTSPEVNNEVPRLEFPSFDGVNPRIWITKCSRYFALYKIPESQRVEVASLHLVGRAATWFARYIAARKYVDWTDFILDVCTCFKDEPGSQVLEDFHKWDKGLYEWCDEPYFPGHKCKRIGPNTFFVGVAEEEVTIQHDFCLGNPLLVDAHQVLEESPKGSIQLSLGDGFGEGQGKVPGGFEVVPCKPLDGLNPSNGLLEQFTSSIQDKRTFNAQGWQPGNAQQLFDEMSKLMVAPRMYEQSKRGEKKGLNSELGPGCASPLVCFPPTGNRMVSSNELLSSLQECFEKPKHSYLVDRAYGCCLLVFDPGGLLLLLTMSSRCVGRCPSELDSVLDVDELGLRVVELVAANVVFDPGGINHNNDELEMAVVETVAALAWRLGKKGTRSCMRCLLMLRSWKRSSSSAHLLLPFRTAYSQSAAPLTVVPRGGVFFMGGGNLIQENRLRVTCWSRVSVS